MLDRRNGHFLSRTLGSILRKDAQAARQIAWEGSQQILVVACLCPAEEHYHEQESQNTGWQHDVSPDIFTSSFRFTFKTSGGNNFWHGVRGVACESRGS